MMYSQWQHDPNPKPAAGTRREALSERLRRQAIVIKQTVRLTREYGIHSITNAATTHRIVPYKHALLRPSASSSKIRPDGLIIQCGIIITQHISSHLELIALRRSLANAAALLVLRRGRDIPNGGDDCCVAGFCKITQIPKEPCRESEWSGLAGADDGNRRFWHSSKWYWRAVNEAPVVCGRVLMVLSIGRGCVHKR